MRVSVFSTHVALWAGMTNGHLPSEECQWKERSQRNFLFNAFLFDIAMTLKKDAEC